MTQECQGTIFASACSIGGHCVVDNVTKEESCVCAPGFLPDQSFLHNSVGKDCSLPQSAHLAWITFQSMVNLVVFFRLEKQFKQTKGTVRDINAYFLAALLFSWLFVLGLVVQGGNYEVSCVSLSLTTVCVVRAAFTIIELFVDARVAVEMKSNGRQIIAMVRASSFLLSTAFFAVMIAAAVMCRTEMFDDIMFGFVGLMFLSLLLIPPQIIYHNRKLVVILKDMISHQRVAGELLDEKPALLQRLQLFRIGVLQAVVLLGLPLCILVASYIVVRVIPLMWLATLLAWLFFPVTGLFLKVLNDLIQTFKLEKLRQQNPSLTTPQALMLLASAPFFYDRKLLSKLYPVKKYQSFISDMFGWTAGMVAVKIARLKAMKFVVTILAPVMQVLAVTTLLRKGILDDIGIIAGGAVIFGIILFLFLTLGNRQIATRTILHSPMFQYRMLLLVGAVISAAKSLGFGQRALILSTLDAIAFVFFCYDILRKDSTHYYEYLIFTCASATPFAVWYILAFDLIDGRSNEVYSNPQAPYPYHWSTYHFTVDMHIFIVWCIFMDTTRLIKNSKQNFLYLSCPINVRIVKLSRRSSSFGGADLNLSSSPTTSYSPFSEIDFSEAEFRIDRRSTGSGLSPGVMRKATLLPTLYDRSVPIGSPRSPPAAPQERPIKFVTGIVIRQEDAILTKILGKVLAGKIIRFLEQNVFWTSFVSGMSIAFGLSLMIGIVVTGITPPGLSLFFSIAFCYPPLVLRLTLTSWRVVRFLMFRVEFYYDFAVFLVLMANLTISIIGPNSVHALRTVPMLVVLILLFLHWRFADALVVQRPTSPFRPEFFIPVLIPLLLLPILIFSGYVPQVTMDTIQLAEPLNSTGLTPELDVFSMFNPPKGSMAKVRRSQVVFDAMLAFCFKLILDFTQRLYMAWTNRKRLLVDHLRCPVAPQTVDEMPSRLDKDNADTDPFFDPPSYHDDERVLIPVANLDYNHTTISNLLEAEHQQVAPTEQGADDATNNLTDNHSGGAAVVPVDDDE